jgi:hypothetical protein
LRQRAQWPSNIDNRALILYFSNMEDFLENDTTRDLVFTSFEVARKFGNALMSAGFEDEATDLRSKYESAGISEQDGDTIHPPVRVPGGLDLQNKIRHLL